MILKRALENRTLAHAYLFSGDAGVGKKLTALALAASVNCADTGPDGACGRCPSCRKVAAQAHPDVHMLVPDGDEIKIDQIRQIQSELSLKPFEGDKKVLIVDGAEQMNQAAANAFLKTLEEPPGDALLILIAAMPQRLLSTIRSRCQEIRFTPLPRRLLAQALVKRRGLPEEDAWLLAALSQGSMGRGLEMDVAQEKEVRSAVAALWAELPGMNDGDVLALAERFAKDRDRFDRMLEIGIEHLRDALVYRQTKDERLLVQSGSGEGPETEVQSAPLQRMLADFDLLAMSRNLLDRRVSAQLVAEHMMFKLARRLER